MKVFYTLIFALTAGLLPAQDAASPLPVAPIVLPIEPDPKTRLATLFTQLKAGISREPQSKNVFVEKFLEIAFEEATEASLAAKLKGQDTMAYESLVAGLKALADGDSELVELVSSRIGSPIPEMHASGEVKATSPPPAEERQDQTAGVIGRFDLENTPHLRQPPKSSWCWAASALIVSQPYKGLNLQGEALATPIGQVFGTQERARGFRYQSTYALSLLGVAFEQRNLAEGFLTQSGLGMADYAKLRLKDEISPILDEGKAMILGCGYLGNKGNHAVCLLKSKEGNLFLTSNPAGEKKWQGIDTIAKWWPDLTQEGNNTHYFFTFTVVHDPLPPEGPLVRPPGEADLHVDLAGLPRLGSASSLNPDRLTYADVKREFPTIRWVGDLSVRWSKTKNVAELEGIALAAKINLAAAALGNNPQAVFLLRRDAVGEGVELVLVDGYRGGFRGLDGELHIRTQNRPEGEWITVPRFNAFFTSLRNGTNPERPYVACFGYAPLAMRDVEGGERAYSLQSGTSVAVKTSASHCFSDDSTLAMADGFLPSRSSDIALPRMTWWPNQGTREWIEYTFAEPIDAAGVRVYWFDDLETKGGCRVPVSARVRYKDGSGWKTEESVEVLASERDLFNSLKFKLVKTTSLRIEVTLEENFSGGVLEWEVLNADGKRIALAP